MAEKIDEITVEYIEDGITTVKELDKVVLTKGAWTTILFKMQNWDRRKEEYSPILYSIRRYQKRLGVYKQRSKFNISNAEQAKKIIEILNNWIDQDKQEAAEADK